MVRSWPDAFDLIPECGLKGELYEQLKGFVKGLSEGFREAFAEAFPKGYAKDYAESGTGTGTGTVAVTEEKTIVESFASDHLPGIIPIGKVDPLEDLLADGFRYFLEQTGHHADQYELDDKRRTMGLAGFRALLSLSAEEIRTPTHCRRPPICSDSQWIAWSTQSFTPAKTPMASVTGNGITCSRPRNTRAQRKLVGYWLNDNNFRSQGGRRSA